MKPSFAFLGVLSLVLAALAGCGSDSEDPATPPPTASTAQIISAAAAVPANDTATNSAASFTVLQDAGVAAVTVASPPKVNFTVFSDGAVKTGLTSSNVRFALAKLVPGADGNPDQWVSYVYRKETAAAGIGPEDTPVLPSAMQATTDTGSAGQLVYNADGYYTYTFSTDITDPAKTNGVVYEPGLTHRVAIQLSYKNAAGETVLVNPYFDFTLGADGKSITVTDPNKTRVMTDVAACNGCHEKLALHGGGRVDTQYCVMCHNPGTVDANSGNELTMATMTHKIHSGRLLKQKLDAGKGGEDYVIWGYGNTKHDYAEVGFPQDLRNCTVCHSGSNPATPQGDNWKTQVSQQACLTCHANNTGSVWDDSHKVYARSPELNGGTAKPTAVAKDLTNQQCVDCHKAGTNLGSDRVHWNQNEENAAKYKMNIESATFDAAARKVTVKYFLSDPTNGNKPHKLVANPSECTLNATGGTVKDCNNTKFGNLKFYLAYQNIQGQLPGVTEFSAYNNGGNAAYACLFEGPTTTGTSPTNACSRTAVNDGSDHYTVEIPLPADSDFAKASGTARVVGIGQIKEAKLQVKWATDPRPEVVPKTLINTIVQHTYKDVVLTGSLQPRRDVVSNDKCNVCHGALGTTSGSNTLADAFHSGARNTVEACVVCHDPNRFSSTVMTNGLALSENYSFKRMIHGIHGNSKRTTPFTHGNAVIGQFSKDGVLLFEARTSGTAANAPLGTPLLPYATSTAVAAGTPFAPGVENYAAEVAYPQVGLNCNSCHVNNSYKTDLGTLGAVVAKPLVGTATPLTAGTDPLKWYVISPKAATCTACHDSPAAIGHVTSYGASSFGEMTQGLRPQETCDDCHAPGGFKGVDIVHGQK